MIKQRSAFFFWKEVVKKNSLRITQAVFWSPRQDSNL